MKFRDRIFVSYLDDGEKILHVAHKHLIVFKFDSLKPTFFGLVIPLILYLFFPQVWPVFLLWGFIGALGVMYVFYDWYCDAWLLTNIRSLNTPPVGAPERWVMNLLVLLP